MPFPWVDLLPPHVTPHLNSWLCKFSLVAAADGDAPAGVKRSLRLLEDTIVAQSHGKATRLDLLIALGEAEKTLDRSRKFAIDKIPPIPYLRSSRWLAEANDGTPEFRLALSLARTGLRQRLVRVRGDRVYWLKEEDDDRFTTWNFGSLVDNLITLVQRSEIEREYPEKTSKNALDVPTENSNEDDNNQERRREIAQRAAHTELHLLPTFWDISAWLMGDLDDERLEAIARGLSLLKFSRSLAETKETAMMAENERQQLENRDLTDLIEALNTEEYRQKQLGRSKDRSAKNLPMAYKLIKLVHHGVIEIGENGQKIQKELPRVPGLISKLSADRPEEAIADAARRLQSSNLRPRIDPSQPDDWWDRGLDASRIAAALAFPITSKQAAILLAQVSKIDN